MLRVKEILWAASGILVRLICVAVGAKAIKTIYGATRADDDDIPTFSTYWRTNARDAIYGAGILCLLYYVLNRRVRHR